MQTEPKATPVQVGANRHLWLRIPAANPGHHPGTYFRRDLLYHAAPPPRALGAYHRPEVRVFGHSQQASGRNIRVDRGTIGNMLNQVFDSAAKVRTELVENVGLHIRPVLVDQL